MNFRPKGPHSFWMPFVEASQFEDEAMSLQRPEVHLSRGHVLDERWAGHSERGHASPRGQELAWEWLSDWSSCRGLVLGADGSRIAVADAASGSRASELAARWGYPQVLCVFSGRALERAV